jgi:hypothetical protein
MTNIISIVGFDVYVVAATNPKGFCTPPSFCQPNKFPEHFTIHGCWPTDTTLPKGVPLPLPTIDPSQAVFKYVSFFFILFS